MFIVITFDDFVARPKEVLAIHECHARYTSFKLSGFALVNLIVTSILLGFYLYYAYVCKLTRDAYKFHRRAILPSSHDVQQCKYNKHLMSK